MAAFPAPALFSIEEAIRELSSPKYTGHAGEVVFYEGEDFFVEIDSTGHNVLMADGTVRFIPIVDNEIARALLNGNCFDGQARVALTTRRYRIHYGNIARLAVFILLVLLPSYWVVVLIRTEQAGEEC